MENLKDIIKEIQKYKKELNLNPSDDQILDTAGRIFNTQFIQSHMQGNKFYKKPFTKTPFVSPTSKFEKITDKQKYALEKLKYKGDLNISKQEAYQLIKSLMETKNGHTKRI